MAWMTGPGNANPSGPCGMTSPSSWMQPLSSCAMENDCGPGLLLLGFTNIAEAEAPRAARRLVRAIGDLL